MRNQTFSLEIHDQPDVLVRIIQAVHRRGGRIRSLNVRPKGPWAEANITVQGIENPTQIARTLEKLVDVRHVNMTTT